MISSDSPEIMSYIRGAFGRMRRVGVDGSLPLDRSEIAVAPERRGIRFNGEPIALSAEETATDFELGWYGSSRLFRESFRRNADWRGFYAAALRIGERACLLAADSGTGKTTLALALLARGARIYSDEFAFVRRCDRMVSGYPRTLLVRQETLALLGDKRLGEACVPSRARQTPAGLRWDFVDVADVFGPDALAEPAPLGAIVLLSRPERIEAPALERVPTALAAIDLSRMLNGDESGFERLTGLAELLAGVPAYRATLGLPAATAALLWERLQ